MRSPFLAMAVAMATTAIPASAQDQAADGPVVAIVRVPKPWYAPRGVVVGKMRDTMPQYAALPGLAFKAFSFERDSGDYGGIYFWRRRSVAQAWFGPAWFERVRKERGVDGQVRLFDAPVSIDNHPGGTAADSDSKAVATLVEIGIPPGLRRDRLVAEFHAAVPTYRQVPGLLRKHFIMSADDNSFGGVYLWQNDAAARAWFNDAWHARVEKSYGQKARITWFDIPILLPGADAAGAMTVAAP